MRDDVSYRTNNFLFGIIDEREGRGGTSPTGKLKEKFVTSTRVEHPKPIIRAVLTPEATFAMATVLKPQTQTVLPATTLPKASFTWSSMSEISGLTTSVTGPMPPSPRGCITVVVRRKGTMEGGREGGGAIVLSFQCTHPDRTVYERVLQYR